MFHALDIALLGFVVVADGDGPILIGLVAMTIVSARAYGSAGAAAPPR